METINNRVSSRSYINTGRIFTESYTDEDMKFYQKYNFAPQIERIVLPSSNKLSYKTFEILFRSFPNVRIFDLDNFWNLDSKATQILSQFKELKDLSFGPSLISTKSFSNFSSCLKLETLKINKCVHLDGLTELKALKTLSVKKCPNLAPNIHKFLNKQNLASLKNLSLEYLEINDKQLREICKSLDQIEQLSVSRCKQLTEKGFKKIYKLKSLERFEARELTNLHDTEVEWPPTLEEIDFRKCKLVGDKICKSLSRNSFKRIDIEETSVSDEGARSLLQKSWEKVKCLRVKACDNITRKMKKEIVKRCVQLEEFSVCGLDSKLFSKLKVEKLSVLRLYDSNLVLYNFQRLFEKARKLIELKLLHCNVDDRVLKMIGTHCKNLIRLGIGDKKITEKGAYYIRRLHPKLQELNISGCSSLSENGLRIMLQDARIHKFKAYGCNLLGPCTFDVLAECGFYLHKIECLLLGGITSTPSNPTFYFALLERLKVNLYGDGRLLPSISRLKRLRRLVFIDTQYEQEDLSILKQSASIEHFEATNGSIVRSCEDPTFLTEWAEGSLKNSLRFLILPFTNTSEQNLSVLNEFPNLVTIEKNNPSKLDQLKDHFYFFSEKRELRVMNLSIYLTLDEFSLEGKVAVVMRANYELQTEIIKQLHSRGCTVFAFYEEKEVRDEFGELKCRVEKEKLGEQIVIIPYIPTEKLSLMNAFKEAVKIHKLEKVDLLFMGSFGIFPERDNTLQAFSSSLLSKHIPDLLYADIFVFQVFEKIVLKTKGSKAIILSNRVSSISDNFSARLYTLRTCGSALHQLSKNVSIEWQRKSDTSVFLVSLGQIQTANFKQVQLNFANSLLQSGTIGAQRVLHVLQNFRPEFNGKMIDFNLKVVNS